MGKNIEQLLKEADFSAGSNHKQKLHDKLFDSRVVSFQGKDGEMLSDDQLENVAGGNSIDEILGKCKYLQ